MKKMESIPKGWSYSSFADLFEFIPTNSLSREMMNYKVGNRSVFNIHYGDIHATFREQILDFQKHLPQIPALINPPKKIDCEAFLKNGDLVIADVSEDYEGVGECIEIRGITGQKVLSGLHTIAARDFAGKTYAGFRAYLFKHPQVSKELKRIATGSKVYGISKSNLANLLLILPPIPEQRKIALILSTWDRAIEKTEQLIDQKQQLKKGLMQQLLTGKARFKEFVKSKKMKKTKLGMVPEDWEVTRLKDLLLEARLGGNYENSESNEGVPVIKMGNLARGSIRTEKVQCLPKFEHHEDEDVLREGDLLFNTRNTLDLVGKVAIWRNELPLAVYNSNLLRMKFQASRVDSTDFMNYVFNSYYGLAQLRAFATGTTSVAAIYDRDLKGFKVMLPSRREQSKICQLLRALEKSICVLQGTLDHTKSQKKGLMQKLLTGKVRVKL